MKKSMAWVSSLLVLSVISTSSLAEDSNSIRVNDVVVEFARTIDVPSRQSGPVVVIDALQNQWVSQGQRIASLDDTALVIRRRGDSLRCDSARLVLQDNIEIRFAETALAEANSELDDSQSASDRVSGAVSRNQLRRTKLAVERAELELDRSKKQRRQAEIDLQLRSADLAMIDHEMAQLQCIAPIDGIVLNVYRELGEWIHAGEPLVTIADAAVLHLHALVDADSLDPARCVGLPVTVHWTSSSLSMSNVGAVVQNQLRANIDRSESSLCGKVISVDPVRLPGNRFRLHAVVENRRHVADANVQANPGLAGDGWLLSPGMKVSMEIHRSNTEIAERKNPNAWESRR